MNALALKILTQAQGRVLNRAIERGITSSERQTMLKDFAHVRNNLDKYRNTSYLRQFFMPRSK